MRYKTTEVESFKYYYKVFDKDNQRFIAGFDELSDAVYWVYQITNSNRWSMPVSFTLKRHVDLVIDYRSWYIKTENRFAILNECGIVSGDDVEEIRNRSWKRKNRSDRCKRYDDLQKRLKKYKNSSKKIKLNCSNDVLGRVRYPKTMNERKQNVGHIDEYGETLVRGRRRFLPSSYDDLPVSIYYSRDSWKHNSKRRKQWIPK